MSRKDTATEVEIATIRTELTFIKGQIEEVKEIVKDLATELKSALNSQISLRNDVNIATRNSLEAQKKVEDIDQRVVELENFKLSINTLWKAALVLGIGNILAVGAALFEFLKSQAK